jgi:DNA processing protein
MIPRIGSITARKLIAYLGSAEAVFKEKISNLRLIPGIGPFLAGSFSPGKYLAEAEAEFTRMEKSGISFIYYKDPEYPWRLKNCEDGPLFLFYRGKPDFHRVRMLSVVGTRNASRYGKEACRSIVASLASGFPDLVIVSGLAYGIDVEAHRSALDYGLDTFAVMAHGLNTVYPYSHRKIASRILDHGGLLTDFHSQVKPERNNFLRRNRIIAGITEATLVIESGLKGGALITADIASSYNREVLALPGRAGDQSSAGCNALIKNNIAALIENSEDIERILNWETHLPRTDPQYTITEPLTAMEMKIMDAISGNPGISQELLCERTGINLPTLISQLLQMELKNWITVLPGNQYKTSARYA